jgi:hypothetical protein
MTPLCSLAPGKSISQTRTTWKVTLHKQLQLLQYEKVATRNQLSLQNSFRLQKPHARYEVRSVQAAKTQHLKFLQCEQRPLGTASNNKFKGKHQEASNTIYSQTSRNLHLPPTANSSFRVFL